MHQLVTAFLYSEQDKETLFFYWVTISLQRWFKLVLVGFTETAPGLAFVSLWRIRPAAPLLSSLPRSFLTSVSLERTALQPNPQAPPFQYLLFQVLEGTVEPPAPTPSPGGSGVHGSVPHPASLTYLNPKLNTRTSPRLLRI